MFANLYYQLKKVISMHASTVPSWELLENGLNPLKGALSKDFGFMFDPKAMQSARIALPARWLRLWKQLPEQFISKRVREICANEVETLDVDSIYNDCANDPLTFMKTKSIVFCIAQACMDFDRVIAQEMPEPEPLPGHVQNAVNRFADYCESPNYCALADMSLTASYLVSDHVDLLSCTFDDFKLICPVNNASSPAEAAAGDIESSQVRGQAENRFHNTPTMMEYRVSDLVGIVAETQQLIHNYRALNVGATESAEQLAIVGEILHHIGKAIDAFKRLRLGFAMLSRRSVDPVVWHRDIVKYTSGYGGHLGLSGPQAPCIHLIDAFLGRANFDTELGKTSKKAFLQMQHNHQVFIKSVAHGPQLRQFAEECAAKRRDHPVVRAFNDLIDSYTQGFLAVHKGRAVEFAKMGFNEAGPREFTAETEYHWPATENVVTKLHQFFDDATDERRHLKIE
ncbi:hypothetical protein ACLMAJ_24555 [Nocardia sp. KC 131]|uniref:hypothetical protein n=1 Tax=Nocardia arseniciresistens TaxID=3392119 RepID=UPI00398F8CC2